MPNFPLIQKPPRKRRWLLCLTTLSIVGLLAPVILGTSSYAQTKPRHSRLALQAGQDFVADELVVIRKDRVEKIKVTSQTREKIRQRFLNQPDIQAIEPNYFAHALSIPNDPYYKYQWNFEQINLPQAWEETTGRGVIVAVVDTGVSRVRDLRKTSFVAGYDFVDDDSRPTDKNGHGTHIAGTIAQSTNNNYGTAGIAYKAKIMPVRVLDKHGRGSYYNIYQGVKWATDHGAQIINLSLGGTHPSRILEEAVRYAYKHGVVVIAAAGNNNAPQLIYPAAYNNYTIAIGAVDYNKQRAFYSNYGPKLSFVAPGGNLQVDQNHDGYPDGILQETPKGFYFYQGTSMAAAHVSGVAALILSHNAPRPQEAFHTVWQSLQKSSQDLGPNGWDQEYGWGLIDAAQALSQLTNQPHPTSLPTPTPPLSPTPTPNPKPQAQISAFTTNRHHTQQTRFSLGEKIYLQGQLTKQNHPIKRQRVLIYLKDPSGQLLDKETDRTNHNGEFKEKFRLKQNWPKGVYYLTISANQAQTLLQIQVD